MISLSLSIAIDFNSNPNRGCRVRLVNVDSFLKPRTSVGKKNYR